MSLVVKTGEEIQSHILEIKKKFEDKLVSRDVYYEYLDEEWVTLASLKEETNGFLNQLNKVKNQR